MHQTKKELSFRNIKYFGMQNIQHYPPPSSPTNTSVTITTIPKAGTSIRVNLLNCVCPSETEKRHVWIPINCHMAVRTLHCSNYNMRLIHKKDEQNQVRPNGLPRPHRKGQRAMAGNKRNGSQQPPGKGIPQGLGIKALLVR